MSLGLVSVQITSLIMPLLASACAWAIAVWALKQNDPLASVVQRLTNSSNGNGEVDAATHGR
jgi:HAMP domain-containing protein